jgi:hypothetical protein
LGFFVGLRVARPDRKPAVTELGQNLADRTFVQHNTEAPLHLVAKIDPPPAHHSMHRRVGASLDERGQFGQLLRRELRSATWRFVIA